MNRVTLDGAFFAEWDGSLQELADFSGVEISRLEIEPPAATSLQVDAERDRRIDAGLLFNGKLYQTRQTDRENISGVALLAAIDPNYSTAWIAADNTETPMDSATLVRFGRAAAERKAALIFAGRALKNMTPIPADFADDKYWP